MSSTRDYRLLAFALATLVAGTVLLALALDALRTPRVVTFPLAPKSGAQVAKP